MFHTNVSLSFKQWPEQNRAITSKFEHFNDQRITEEGIYQLQIPSQWGFARKHG
jgi:hypothetical protein